MDKTNEQVYIFDFGDKIKVGYSTNVKKRLRTIELSSGIEAIRTYSVAAGRPVEKALHSKLENRMLGEFFAFPFEQAKTLLDEIINNGAANKRKSGGTSEQLKILCIKLNISVSELARRCGTSPQAFSQKMKREGFTPSELKNVAEAVGCKYESAFILPNGEQVID